MVRTLTTDAQAQADQKLGTEPLVILKIEWGSGTLFYADKDLEFQGNDAIGAILDVSPVSTTGKQDDLGEISSVNITLDDTDGSLKAKVDKDIIEGTPVTIFHNFETLVEADAIVLLKGKIIGDVTWNEGNRALSFSVESIIESDEVGFAPKAGDFTDLNAEVIGVPWPLVFGTVLKIPAVRIKQAVNGFTTEQVLPTTPFFNVENGSKFPQGTSIQIDIARIRFTGSFDNNKFTPTSRNDAIFTSINIVARVVADLDFNNAAVLWIDSTAPIPNLVGLYCFIAGSFNFVNRCVSQVGNRCRFAKPWRPNNTFDQVLLSDTFGGSIFEVAALPRASWGVSFTLEGRHGVGFIPGADQTNLLDFVFYEVKGDNWKIFPIANTVLVVTFADLYVANLISSTEILEVWGHRRFQNRRIFNLIPSSRYVVTLSDTLAGQTPTTIGFTKRLEDFERENWEGDVFVSLRSSQGPNVADIIQFIIEEFTNLAVDATSFASVKTKIANFPAGFAVFDQPDAIELIQDIAFQARCAVFVRNGVVFLTYLSEIPTSSFALSEPDIELKTLELSFVTSEELITRIISKWRSDYSEEGEEREIISSRNIDKFGLREQEIDFFIYNIESLVQLSTDFWGFRNSNSWRLIQYLTFLTTLEVEVFDTINHTLAIVSANSLRGIVEETNHNSVDPRIGIMCRLASKAGDVDGGNEPIEDTSFYTGDPSNPTQPAPALPDDVGENLSEIDYLPGRDTKDKDKEDDEDEEDNADELEFRIKFTFRPDQVVRGINFTIKAEIQDEDGNLIGRNVDADLRLTSSDSSDVLNTSSVKFVNGAINLTTIQITGGTLADTGFLTLEATLEGEESERGDIQEVTGVSNAFEIVDESPNLNWDEVPDKEDGIIRGEQIHLELSGPAGAVVTLALEKPTDTNDVLKDLSGIPITTVTLNGGKLPNEDDFKIEGGTGDDDSTVILASFDPGSGVEREYSIRFPIRDEDATDATGREVVNVGSVTIPGGGSAMEVVGVDSNGLVSVRRPASDNIQPGLILFNLSDVNILVAAKGTGHSAFDTAIDAIFSGATPAIGDILKTQTGLFTLITGGNVGFVNQGQKGGSTASIRPFRGAIVITALIFDNTGPSIIESTDFNAHTNIRHTNAILLMDLLNTYFKMTTGIEIIIRTDNTALETSDNFSTLPVQHINVFPGIPSVTNQFYNASSNNDWFVYGKIFPELLHFKTLISGGDTLGFTYPANRRVFCNMQRSNGELVFFDRRTSTFPPTQIAAVKSDNTQVFTDSVIDSSGVGGDDFPGPMFAFEVTGTVFLVVTKTITSGQEQRLYSSVDGVAWTFVGLTNLPGFMVAPTRPIVTAVGTVLIGRAGKIFRSVSPYTTWTQVTALGGISYMPTYTRALRIRALPGSTVLESLDDGLTWVNAPAFSPITRRLEIED